jgi:hypothetical protein
MRWTIVMLASCAPWFGQTPTSKSEPRVAVYACPAGDDCRIADDRETFAAGTRFEVITTWAGSCRSNDFQEETHACDEVAFRPSAACVGARCTIRPTHGALEVIPEPGRLEIVVSFAPASGKPVTLRRGPFVVAAE